MINMKKIMWISIISGTMITVGVILLLLSTLPMMNTLEGNTFTVNFVIGKKAIDMTDACYMPVPEDVKHDIIRVGGTSIGKKHSGHFMNYKTRTKYIFYLTGNGEQTYFEIGPKKYLVDGISRE